MRGGDQHGRGAQEHCVCALQRRLHILGSRMRYMGWREAACLDLEDIGNSSGHRVRDLCRRYLVETSPMVVMLATHTNTMHNSRNGHYTVSASARWIKEV